MLHSTYARSANMRQKACFNAQAARTPSPARCFGRTAWKKSALPSGNALSFCHWVS